MNETINRFLNMLVTLVVTRSLGVTHWNLEMTEVILYHIS